MVKQADYEQKKRRVEEKVHTYEELEEKEIDLKAETALSLAQDYLSLKEPRKARHYFEIAADLFHYGEGPDSKKGMYAARAGERISKLLIGEWKGLPKRYIPKLKFIEGSGKVSRIKPNRNLRFLASKESRLERKTSTLATIIGFIGGLYFLSPNLTGFAVSNASSSTNLVGILFIFIGLIGAFFLLRGNKI